MSELGSLVASEAISEMVNWGAARISDRKKQRDVANLLHETTIRAAMVLSPVDLVAKFKNEHLVEELLAHRELADKSKGDVIATFLGKEADNTAIKFVGEFYDQINVIMATADESLVNRKTLEAVEETGNDIRKFLETARKYKTDESAQITLLEKVVPLIASGGIEVGEISNLAERTPDSLASSYLRAYYALCTEGRTDFSSLDTIRGHDGLILPLVSIAISAKRVNDVVAALSLCSFDTKDISAAAHHLLEKSPFKALPVEIKLPDIKGVAEIIELLNLEYLYGRNAFPTAVEYASEKHVSENPIATEELWAARLMTTMMFNDPELPGLLAKVIARQRAWFPARLDDLRKRSLSSALIGLDPKKAKSVIGTMPDDLEEFARDEEKRLALRSCRNAAKAKEIVVWAEARHNQDLLVLAATKAVELDESWRPEAIETYERCKGWAFPTKGLLDIYVNTIEPDISYEKLQRYGRGLENDPAFHLIAYKKLKSSDAKTASEHIELAIAAMKSPSGAPDLIRSDAWVPYLIANNRTEELKGLVVNVLPLAPYEHVMALLSAVDSCPGTEGLLDELISSTVGSKFSDARTAELVAHHLSASGQTGLAGRVARSAFGRAPSETLAEIAAQWMLGSSLNVDESITRYATKADTARMNILLAHVARENGMTQEQNARLIRAAFDNSEVCERALSLYACWNIGGEENGGRPETIDPDTYAIFAVSDGGEETFFFLSDQSSVKTEGAHCPAGTLFSTHSSEFLRRRGLREGNIVSLEGRPFTVVEVGEARTFLIRKGLELAVHTGAALALTGTPEEALEKINEIAEKGGSCLGMYTSGIETNRGVLHLGIQTGSAVIDSSRRLEFIVEAVRNPRLPYRKHPLSVNRPLASGCKFLLSYNATVVLALLAPSTEVRATICERCLVSESTARQLTKNAAALADKPYSSLGRLGHDNGRPVFYEFDDNTRHQAGEIGAAILSLLDSIEKVSPSLSVTSTELGQSLDDNELIDIGTTSENGFVYVTEDVVEAKIIDCLSLSARCSLSAMLFFTDHVEYVIDDYARMMAEWGAIPVLEPDLVGFLQRAPVPTEPEAAPDSEARQTRDESPEEADE